ncbi:Cna B-type domain-containing protein [Oceanobacillus locisalsi]|uniref:Cna B-type domain-containing protein n=1 Tax=Oceanobacillus locisalsi TaxID=546107 RepID=A0ABW3NJW3_9BACI
MKIRAKRVSIWMIFLLLMQSIVTGIAPLQTAQAEENNSDTFFDFASITESSFSEKDGDGFLQVDWSLKDYEIEEAGQPVDFQSPVALTEQEGTLSLEEEAVEIASFEATEDAIRVTFHEAALEHPEAEGTLKLQVLSEEDDEVVEEEAGEEPVEEVAEEEGTEESAEEEAAEEEGTEESAEEEAAEEEGTEESAEEEAAEEEGTEESAEEEAAEEEGTEESAEEEATEEEGTEESAEEEAAEEEGTEESAEEEAAEEEGTEESAEEEAAEEENTASSAASDVGPQVELENIFEFEYFRLDGEDVEDGAEVDFDATYQIQYAWDTNDLDVNAGDTATLELPDVFLQWENTPDQNITVSDGTVVGTYTINDGVLEFTFNENIEGESVQDGYVGFGLEFDREKFTEEWEQEIDFDGDGNKDLTVVTTPNEIDTSMDKRAELDSETNATEITWTVDIVNGGENPLTNGVLTDTLPDGVGNPENFVVRPITYDVDGEESVGEPLDLGEFSDPTIGDGDFNWDLGDIPERSGYQVEYTTSIEDYEQGSFTNDAEFHHDDGELEAQTTVDGGERSNPIQKSGEQIYWSENEDEIGQIRWTITVNEGGSSIDEAIVHDELPEGLGILSDSIAVDKNGEDVTADFDTADFPINLGEVSRDEVYTITFVTEIDWAEVNDGNYQHGNTFTNKGKLTDGDDPIGEDDATVDYWRDSLLEKSGNQDFTYEDKNLSWEITVNEAGHPVDNAVLTDTLPAGLGTITAEDIHIDGADVDPSDIRVTQNEDGTQTVVVHLGNIDSAVTIAYTTEVEDFAEDSFRNEATLEGDGIGEEGTEGESTVDPPANEFGKSFEGIDYNAKTMDWQLTANPNREPIDSLTITDTFPNDGLYFLEDSLEVTLGGEAFDDYSLELSDDGHSGFVITINDGVEINDELVVTYKTSYDPDIIENEHSNDDEPNRYLNNANYEGETNQGHEFDEDRDAHADVNDQAWNSGYKTGNLVDADNWSDETDRKIAWQVYTNYHQNNLGENVSVTDTLDYDGEIIEDSIKVSIYDVAENGDTSMTDTELTPGEDYTVDIDGDELTVNFTGEVTERYVIEFETTVPDISEENYVNNAVVNTEDGEFPYSSSVDYNKWNDILDKQVLDHEGTEAYIGDELDWEITVNESLSRIQNATLTDTISTGLSFVEDSLTIVTSSGDELTEGEDYTLEVNNDEDGQTILNIEFTEDVTQALTLTYSTIVTAEDGQGVNNTASFDGQGIETKTEETEEITATQFSWVGGEFRDDRGVIEVRKVDSSGEIIDSSEAVFELYRDVNGEEVLMGEFSTENGVLEIPNLNLGTYVLKEMEAPDGYRLSEEEMEVEVDQAYGEEEYVFEEEFRNISDAKTEIPVEKVWDDAENQDGQRSESIEVELLANGETTDFDNLELHAENNWEDTFTGLPELDEAGEEITYTIQEVDVPEGYESNINGDMAEGFDITNSYTPEVTDISGTKTWDDADNQDGVRPESITVNLLANGTEVDEQTVTAEDDWGYTFTDLPKFEAGEEITYTVTENSVEDYTTTTDGYDITNTHTPEERSVTVTKAWEDANNQDDKRSESVDVQLFANGEEYGEPITLSDENEWTHTWTELAVNEAGEEITYTVEELDVHEDYHVNINDEDLGNITITNSYEPEVTNISGTKTWDDADNQDGERPESVTVNLFANGEEIDSQEVTAADDWNYTFDSLPVNQPGEVGQEIEYTVEEEAVESYEVSYDGYDITNSYTPEVTEVSGTKTWDDADNQDGVRPESITVNLLANGEEVDEQTVTAEDDWGYTFTDLPKFEAGEEITYTVTEDSVEDYTTTTDNHDITNTHTPEQRSVTVTKAWDDANNQDGKRSESIDVQLFANGEEYGEPITLSDENEWTHTWTELAVNEAGEEITYTVEELNVHEDYDVNINDEDLGNVTITNSYNPEVTEVSGTKTWDDADNQDGERPESITVNLLADGEQVDEQIVTAADDWSYTFDNLPVNQPGEVGQEIEYTVEEEVVEGYEVSYDGYDITNSYEPEVTEVSGTKTWDDADNQDGERPESITVNLLANGEEVDEQTVTAADDWSYTFADLPQFEAGEEIIYTVTEDSVDGYTTTTDGYDITNTHTPEERSVTVTKAWEDVNNQDGKRSESVDVQLFANGEEYGDPITLSDENEWTHTWTELAVNEAGEEITYTVEELNVHEDYDVNINDEDLGNVTIINSYNPEMTDFSGTKTWDDADNQDGKRPEAITVNLLANGEEVDSVEVTADTDWKFEFTDHPKFENGEEINYTIQEETVEGYSTEIDGMDITNTYTPEQTSINVVKRWNDGNYKEVRPEAITVNLLADGEEVDSAELNESNNWQADFTALDTFADGEEINYTVVEEEVDGYVSSVNVKDQNNVVIVNSPEKVSVGDYVWFDENKDGLQDETDIPIEGVVLTIEDVDGNPVTDVYGNPVEPVTTDENGYYIFDNLPIDNTYIVRIDREASSEALEGYVPTLEEVGNNRSIDSSTWFAVSRHLTEDGEHDPTLDFGFVKAESEDPKDPETPGEPGEDPKDPETPGEPGEDPKDPETPGEPGEDPKDPETPGEPGEDPKDPETPGEPGEDPKDPETSEGSEENPEASGKFEDSGEASKDTDASHADGEEKTDGDSDAKTEDSKDGGDSEADKGDEGETLPGTATSMFNLLLIGLGLLAAGAIVIIVYRFRNRSSQ